MGVSPLVQDPFPGFSSLSFSPNQGDPQPPPSLSQSIGRPTSWSDWDSPLCRRSWELMCLSSSWLYSWPSLSMSTYLYLKLKIVPQRRLQRNLENSFHPYRILVKHKHGPKAKLSKSQFELKTSSTIIF